MNEMGAEQIVSGSLKEHGANCRTIYNLQGETEIIASWKITNWRILARRIFSKDEKLLHLTARDVNKFQNKAQKENQTAVIAWVYSDGNIEYRSAKDDKILRPRCLVKEKIKILK